MGWLIGFFVAFILSILWANAIDKMKKDDPNYKGDDFLM